MANDNQLKIQKLMCLSEAKAKLDDANSEFSDVRHNLDDAIRELAAADELSTEAKEEYLKIVDETFHIMKFIENLGYGVRSKRRVVEGDMWKILGDHK